MFAGKWPTDTRQHGGGPAYDGLRPPGGEANQKDEVKDEDTELLVRDEEAELEESLREGAAVAEEADDEGAESDVGSVAMDDDYEDEDRS